MGRKLNKKFLRITHEIVRAMKGRAFTPAESSVVWAIIEGTYGTWDPAKGDVLDRNEFPIRTLAKETGMDKTRVHSALKSLVEDGIVIVFIPGTPKSPGVYGIENHAGNWRRLLNSVSRSDGTQAFRCGGTGKFQKRPAGTGRSCSAVTGRGCPAEKGHSVPLGRDQSVPTGRDTDDEQYLTTSSIPLDVDRVDLPSVVVDRKTAAAKVIAFKEPECAFPRREVERLIAPLGCLVISGDNLTAATRFFELDGTQRQKLDALATAVGIKRAILDAKPGLRGKIVQYAFEEAAVHLAAMAAPSEPEPVYRGRPEVLAEEAPWEKVRRERDAETAAARAAAKEDKQ